MKLFLSNFGTSNALLGVFLIEVALLKRLVRFLERNFMVWGRFGDGLGVREEDIEQPSHGQKLIMRFPSQP